nr:MAG TPA: hypothetical protein [Caudoviricetes sp.]
MTTDQKVYHDILKLREHLEYLLTLSDTKVLGYFYYEDTLNGGFDLSKTHKFSALFTSYDGNTGTHFTLDHGRFSLLEFDTETGERTKFVNTAIHGDKAIELYQLLVCLDNKINW